MKSAIPALAAAFIATLGASSAAQAAVNVIDFSIAASNTGAVSYTGSTLGNSTSFNLDASPLVVSSVGPDDNSSGLVVGDPLTITSATMPAANMLMYGTMPGTLPIDVVKMWMGIGGMFTETLTTVDSITRGVGAISVVLTGTVTGPAGSGFLDTPASLVLSATQAGGHGAAISVSMTDFARDPTVPEPATWVMMGLGFIGLGYAAVRRGKMKTAMLSA